MLECQVGPFPLNEINFEQGGRESGIRGRDNGPIWKRLLWYWRCAAISAFNFLWSQDEHRLSMGSEYVCM